MFSTNLNKAFGEIIPTDRRIDWNPGVQDGIPNYPNGVNVKVYGAKGDA